MPGPGYWSEMATQADAYRRGRIAIFIAKCWQQTTTTPRFLSILVHQSLLLQRCCTRAGPSRTFPSFRCRCRRRLVVYSEWSSSSSSSSPLENGRVTASSSCSSKDNRSSTSFRVRLYCSCHTRPVIGFGRSVQTIQSCTSIIIES